MLEAGRRPTPQSSQALAAGILAVLLALTGASVVHAQPKVYDLKSAVDIAIANHPGLATITLRADAAKTGISVAGAQYRPTLDNVLTAERVLAGDKSQSFGDTNAAPINTVPASQIYSGALNLNIPLVREGRLVWVTLPSEQAAMERYEAVKSQVLLTRADVAGTVSVTFFAALGAAEDVKVSQQFVELNRVLLQNARLRFAQQLVPQSEVKAAEAALASAAAALEVSRSSLTRGLSNFLTSIGYVATPEAVAKTELVDRDPPPTAPAPLTDLLNVATTSHPSVLAQEAVVKQAEFVYRTLETERYPKLDFSTRVAGADTNAPNTNNSNGSNNSGVSTSDKHSDFWSLRAMLQMNWRIWDFGLLGLKLKEQGLTIQAERSALNEAKSRVTKGVVDAYQTLVNAYSKLSAVEKELVLAEELVRVARERFQQNLIPSSDLLQAEGRLATARKAVIQTEYEVRIDQALLRIAMGTETG